MKVNIQVYMRGKEDPWEFDCAMKDSSSEFKFDCLFIRNIEHMGKKVIVIPLANIEFIAFRNIDDSGKVI